MFYEMDRRLHLESRWLTSDSTGNFLQVVLDTPANQWYNTVTRTEHSTHGRDTQRAGGRRGQRREKVIDLTGAVREPNPIFDSPHWPG